MSTVNERPRLREIAPGVHVATSRLMATNTTVLVGESARHGEGALLIDPGWLPDELGTLADEISARWRVIGGFATHAHYDHLLWHPGFGDAPRWASARTAELAHSEREALVEQLGAGFPAELADLMGRVAAVGDSIPSSSLPEGCEVELIVHDGHAPGHTALWLPRQRVLLAGDMLSDVELPLPFSPDDLPSYVAALDRLAPYVAQAELVVPGHGSVGADAQDRLDADRRYIDEMVGHGTSEDPRVHNPGMGDAYAQMAQLVRGLSETET